MKLVSTRTSDTAFSIGTLILRVGAGSILMINYGYGKLVNFADLSQKFGDPLGIGKPVSLSLAVFAEFFCAAFVVLGLFTRLAAFVIVLLFGVIVFLIKKNVFGEGGGELPALFLASYLAILLLGPGKYSLDRFISK